MRITTGQIRAARALLNWSQTELAEKCAVSLTTIGNIENGGSQPRENTLADIQKALEDGGIEFTEDEGVRRQRTEIKRYDGRDGFRRFFDDIYETLRVTKGTAAVSNADERAFVSALGEDYAKMHIERMKSISDISYKVLVSANQSYTPGKGYIEYRQMKAKNGSSVPFYVYGNKLAIILFAEKPQVIVINHQTVADAYMQQFNAMWEEA